MFDSVMAAKPMKEEIKPVYLNSITEMKSKIDAIGFDDYSSEIMSSTN